MTKIQKEKIKKVVYVFSKLANVNDEKKCEDLIVLLCNMSEQDVIDYLVVALNDLVESGQVKVDDDNTEVLYFKNAKATFYSFTEEPKVIEF